jgi:PiT family inorganic phosphate transporter
MISLTTFVIIIIVFALIFDFVNGFHDAANAIATIVVTNTLTPLQAVLLAGGANFLGYFFSGVAVAKMVGKGIVHVDAVTLQLIMATLVGAVLWNILTWLLGLPTSSSHALIGGLVGSAICASGLNVIIWPGVIKIFTFIIIAPTLGFLSAMIFTTTTIWIFRPTKPQKANSIFKILQLVSATSASMAHGTNDAQKTMGIIALTLFTAGMIKSFEIDSWVVLASYAAISLGTVFGGWRIIKTMGTNIIKMRQMDGFCANSTATIVVYLATHLGIPVSTTHVIAGSIMGVGTVQKAANVKWVTARKIIWAWFLTIPAAATVAALAYLPISKFLIIK